MPVANNAVASGVARDRPWIFSFLGIDSTKRWSGITRAAFAWSPGMSAWQRLPDVPGPVGRLAATAQVVRGKVYLFGGYTVDSAGGERSLDVVDVWDPASNSWGTAPPMTVAVDDAVSATWRDSLVYLVSGWHHTDNVPLVQVFDVVERRWTQATPIPGPGVFGHTGGIAGNTLVYVDGARRQAGKVRYGLEASSWAGEIDSANPLRIIWRRLPPHPGPPIYRAAAAGCGSKVVIAGGTDNPYNYNGIGYDGVPAVPRRDVFAWDTRRGAWTTLAPAPTASMDHRALVVRGDTAVVAGGMRGSQQVTSRIERWPLGRCSG
jgi:Kelch motif